jgi:hypothetical protein
VRANLADLHGGANYPDWTPQLCRWELSYQMQTNPHWVWHSEAETGARTGSMQRGSDSGGASACYYVSDPVANSGSAVTFNVTVPYADTYYLWARAMGLGWDQNSFTVFVDNTEVRQFEIRQVDGQWAWGWHQVADEVSGSPVVTVFPLPAGSHTTRFQSRERNTRLEGSYWSTAPATCPRSSRPAARLRRLRPPAHRPPQPPQR